MATLTIDPAVRTFEHEVRLRVVVEPPFGPVDRVVAECTVIIEAICVRIVVAMTVDAIRWGIAEYMGIVAGIAFLVRMGAEQRESREVVIEKHVLLP